MWNPVGINIQIYYIMEKLYYIYGLIDPITSDVKYVGLTTNPTNRYNQHYYNHQVQSKKKYEWIDELKSKKLRPQMSIFETIETSDRNVALNLEQKWIDIHKDSLLDYRHPQTLQNSKKGKYISIMIKYELKKLMDDTIVKIGNKMSYSHLIKYLIERNENLEKN